MIVAPPDLFSVDSTQVVKQFSFLFQEEKQSAQLDLQDVLKGCSSLQKYYKVKAILTQYQLNINKQFGIIEYFRQMLKAKAEKITLKFKQPAGTSRGVLKTKNSWIISMWDDENPEIVGLGEASIIENLSPEWSNHYEKILHLHCAEYGKYEKDVYNEIPSLRFALEQAMLDLKNGGKQCYFDNPFYRGDEGIRINGLIWMGEKDFMFEQIKKKLDAGFSCLKLKIGAINFQDELDLLKYIRQKFGPETLELRVDANGAFLFADALNKLDQLSKFDLHSIEQPIAAGQWDEMRQLCERTPLPIALDEELIGIPVEDQKMMIDNIKPQYIILKPSLVGGFSASNHWIHCAEQNNVGWWITSALESNVGLNAIAQYTASKNNPMPQGLGTGQLFENNTASTLKIVGEQLFHH